MKLEIEYLQKLRNLISNIFEFAPMKQNNFTTKFDYYKKINAIFTIQKWKNFKYCQPLKSDYYKNFDNYSLSSLSVLCFNKLQDFSYSKKKKSCWV